MSGLYHYSSREVSKVKSAARQEVAVKPNGFWVSVDGDGDGWADWCKAEDFRIESLAKRHEVTLTDGARILRCADAVDLGAFTERYQVRQSTWFDPIDWPRVAAEYQGIIIAPYIWHCRLRKDTGWYYGWDCASGCIWDATAIASVKLL